MALSSKEQKIAQLFREKLEQLSCPYIEGVEESWIIELVFRPGEPRIRLLQWLFTRFDDKLHHVLDPQFAANDSKMDSRIQRLLYVTSTLGLCSPDDADLIRGTCPSSRQMSFMEQLIDMVCIVDAADDPRAKAMQSPGHINNAMSVDEQFSADCDLVDVLAASNSTLFTDEVKLLPPDIMKHIQAEWSRQGHTEHSKIPLPDLSQLNEQAETLSKDLDRQAEILHQLQAKHTYQRTDPQSAAKVHCTLRLILSELSQLVVGFSYCFENEMRAWCNKSPPRLTQLGPAFKRVHGLLETFTTLLSSVGNIRGSYSCLTGEMKSAIRRISDNDQKLVKSSGRLDELKDFHDCVEVLEESIVRLDNTMNTSLRSALTISTIKAD